MDSKEIFEAAGRRLQGKELDKPFSSRKQKAAMKLVLLQETEKKLADIQVSYDESLVAINEFLSEAQRQGAIDSFFGKKFKAEDRIYIRCAGFGERFSSHKTLPKADYLLSLFNISLYRHNHNRPEHNGKPLSLSLTSYSDRTTEIMRGLSHIKQECPYTRSSMHTDFSIASELGKNIRIAEIAEILTHTSAVFQRELSQKKQTEQAKNLVGEKKSWLSWLGWR